MALSEEPARTRVEPDRGRVARPGCAALPRNRRRDRALGGRRAVGSRRRRGVPAAGGRARCRRPRHEPGHQGPAQRRDNAGAGGAGDPGPDRLAGSRPRRGRVPHHLVRPAVGGADGTARRFRRPARHLHRPPPGGGGERRSRAAPQPPRRGRARNRGRGAEQGPRRDRHQLEPGGGAALRVQRRGSDRPAHLLHHPPRSPGRGAGDPRPDQARRTARDLRDRAGPRRRRPRHRLADGLADPQPDARAGRRLGRRPRHHRRGAPPPGAASLRKRVRSSSSPPAACSTAHSTRWRRRGRSSPPRCRSWPSSA